MGKVLFIYLFIMSSYTIKLTQNYSKLKKDEFIVIIPKIISNRIIMWEKID